MRECGGYQVGQVGDGEGFVGSDVVGAVRCGVCEHGPEPDGEVGHVEEAAEGGAVALDVDGFAREGVADEVADGEVLVERKVGADEREAAGDDALEWRIVGVGDAEMLRHALGFVVGALQEQWVGASGVGFGDSGEAGDVAAVHRSGAGVEQAAGSGFAGELEDAAGALEDGVGQVVGVRGGR